MWVWDQSSGTMSRDGLVVGVGYSGADLGKNNPAMESAVGVGPIPTGMWVITDEYDSPHTGPFTLALSPAAGTDTEGRNAFRIHGDSISSPGTASHGCIILPRTVRNTIWTSGDRSLQVVA